MAHVNMHQYSSHADVGSMLLNAGIKRGELRQREKESRRETGTKLQTTQSQLDTEIEKAKINAMTQRSIANKRIGVDLQLKQMGIDADITIQQMRNLNAEQVELLKRETQKMLEKLKDKNTQAQILQQYRANLKLANYNAKAALLRTFNEVMGDIYKTGNPKDNAVDAAAYSLFVTAFMKTLYDMGGSDILDSEFDDSMDISDMPHVELPKGGTNGKQENGEQGKGKKSGRREKAANAIKEVFQKGKERLKKWHKSNKERVVRRLR